MRRQHVIAGTLILTGFAAIAVSVLLSTPGVIPAQARDITPATFFPPLPPVPTPPDIVPLEPIQKLGKLIIYDNTLSNPPGYSCFQCHAPTTGGTSGLSSVVNFGAGPQPGVVPGRSGPRRPLGYPYAAFSPVGPYFDAVFANAWVGGTFWDGRTPDLSTQANQPFINPDEMNNTPTNGVYPPTFGGYSALVVEKVHEKYRALFEQVYGVDVFNEFPTQVLYALITQAEAAYESSGEVNQFSSKYDASIYGVPPQNKYELSGSELRGLELYFGYYTRPNGTPVNAHCAECHSSSMFPPVLAQTKGKDTFTMYCFANIGVPRNFANPIYQETDCTSNPHGCNPLGTNFIDYGLGANPNPAPDGTVFNNPLTNSQYLGLFVAPTTRNVDLRPSPDFVKAYFHNGWAKSLETVVHFYNKRNIARNAAGHEVAFDLTVGPPTGYTRLFSPPEVLTNVNNVQGIRDNTPGVAQVGNLGLLPSEETDLVNFLKILSDGFTTPNPAF